MSSSSMKFFLLLVLLGTVPAGFASDLGQSVGGNATNVPSPQRSEVLLDKTDFRYRDETISEDLTWHGTVLVEGWLTVAPQATLSMQPGTIVRFRGSTGRSAGLLVTGRLNVAGSAQQPVLLTSVYADPLAGDWQGVTLTATEKNNQLNHLRIEGAVTGFQGAFANLTMTNAAIRRCQDGIRLQDSLVVISSSTIADCGAGISLDASEVELQEVAISAARHGIMATGSSLDLYGCSLTGNTELALRAEKCRLRLQRTKLSDNLNGAFLMESEGIITGCRVVGNRETALEVSQSRLKVAGCDLSGNGIGVKAGDHRMVLVGNAIQRNSKYNVFYSGTEMLLASSNWWGNLTTEQRNRTIYDQQADPSRGRVLVEPALSKTPLTD